MGIRGRIVDVRLRPVAVPMRAVLAAALTLAMALALAAVPAQPAEAEERYHDTFEIVADRATQGAVEWSKLTFPDGASEALLARADDFADALASGSLQDGRPLILTAGNSLSSEAAGELARLDVDKVTILGGTNAIRAEVQQTLEANGYDTARLSGPTRLETAIEVAKRNDASTVIIARAFGIAGQDPSQAFADSLAVSAWSAATGWPVLLTERDRLSSSTKAFIEQVGVSQAMVVGGTAAISSATESQLDAIGVNTSRVAGATRFDTATAIAKKRGFATGGAADRIILVDGQGDLAWSDGFVAAAHAAAHKAPVVLANSASDILPSATRGFLADATDSHIVFGWTVPEPQVVEAADIAGKPLLADLGIFDVALSWKNVPLTSNNGTQPLYGHGAKPSTGSMKLTVNVDDNTIDYELAAGAPGPFPAKSVTIRKAGFGANGPVVVTFPQPATDGTGGGTVGSSAFATGFKATDLRTKPSDYYVQVNTNAKPAGAVRGQLPTGGQSELPADPLFESIKTLEFEPNITVNFNVPVFAPAGLAPSDFTVTQTDDATPPKPQPVAVSEVVGGPTTSTGASKTITLKLDSPAVGGKTMAVTLNTSGADKLLNNLGVKPAVATRSAVTVKDVTAPVYAALEAYTGTRTLTMIFSEPVYTDGAVAEGKFTATVTAPNGQSVTPSGVKNPVNIAVGARTNRVRLTLVDAAPVLVLGSKVDVRIVNDSAGAQKFKDRSGNILSQTTLVRSAVVADGPSLSNVTITPLVVGSSDGDPTTGQTQTFTFKVTEQPIPATQKIKLTLPGTAAKVEYGSTGNQVAVTPATGSGSVTVASGNQSVEVTFSEGVPKDATVTVTIPNISVKKVEVTGDATGDPAPLGVTIERLDTGMKVMPTFHTKKGVHVLEFAGRAAQGVPGGPTNAFALAAGWTQDQVIELKVRGGLPAGGSIDVNLSGLTGVQYPTDPLDDTTYIVEEDGGIGVTFTTATPDRSTHRITAPAGVVIPTGTLIRVRVVGVEVSSTSAADDRVVTFTRSDAVDSLSVTQTVDILRSISGPVSPGAPVNDVGMMGAVQYASSVTQMVAFSLHGAAPVGHIVSLTLPAYVTYPTNIPSSQVSPSGSATVTAKSPGASQTLQYYAPMGGLPSGTTVTIELPAVDASAAQSREAVTYQRLDDSGFTGTTGFTVNGAPAETLRTADFTPAPALANSTTFGAVGDKLELIFGGDVPVANTTVITIGSGSSAETIDCADVTCDISGDSLLISIGAGDAQTPITEIVGKKVTKVSDDVTLDPHPVPQNGVTIT